MPVNSILGFAPRALFRTKFRISWPIKYFIHKKYMFQGREIVQFTLLSNRQATICSNPNDNFLFSWLWSVDPCSPFISICGSCSSVSNLISTRASALRYIPLTADNCDNGVMDLRLGRLPSCARDFFRRVTQVLLAGMNSSALILVVYSLLRPRFWMFASS